MRRTITSVSVTSIALATLLLGSVAASAQAGASAQTARQCEDARKACVASCDKQFAKDTKKKAECAKDSCWDKHQNCLNAAGNKSPATNKTGTNPAAKTKPVMQ